MNRAQREWKVTVALLGGDWLSTREIGRSTGIDLTTLDGVLKGMESASIVAHKAKRAAFRDKSGSNQLWRLT